MKSLLVRVFFLYYDEYSLTDQHKHRDPLEIGKAIDIWAIGVTLYCLVFGRLPFEADYEFELFHKISKDP